MAVQLLKELDPEAARESSWLNYHAIGFDYLCLHRSPGLTIKLYMGERIEGCGNGDYLVNPHSHAYTFDTFVLHGAVRNITFSPLLMQAGARSEHGYREFRYDTASRKTKPMWPHWMLYPMAQDFDAHTAGYRLVPDDIHTIEISRSMPTCMLLFQYADTCTTTRLFMRGDDPPNLAGLYIKPTIPEVYELVQRAKDLIGVT